MHCSKRAQHFILRRHWQAASIRLNFLAQSKADFIDSFADDGPGLTRTFDATTTAKTNTFTGAGRYYRAIGITGP